MTTFAFRYVSFLLHGWQDPMFLHLTPILSLRESLAGVLHQEGGEGVSCQTFRIKFVLTRGALVLPGVSVEIKGESHEITP